MAGSRDLRTCVALCGVALAALVGLSGCRGSGAAHAGDNRFGSWAQVRGPAVVGVRVVGAWSSGEEAAFQRQLLAAARQIAEAVAASR